MALAYYLIDEGPTYQELIDDRGRFVRLVWWSRFSVWTTEDIITGFNENNVGAWDRDDQENWWALVGDPAIDPILHNTVGTAFPDPGGVYSDLPPYKLKDQAFRLYDYVYVPDGAVHPLTGETEGNTVVVPSFSTGGTPDDPGGEGDDLLDGSSFPAPSFDWQAIVGGVVSGCLVAGATWFVMDKFGG